MPWPALQTALDAHGSVAAALDAGDYYAAFVLARQEHEATRAYMDFGLWCLGDEDLASRKSRLLLIAVTHTERGIPSAPTGQFEI